MPAVASEKDPVPEYLNRIEEFSQRTQKFLEGLAEKLGPALDELGPKFEELFAKIGDWSLYEAPEVLPNGDIIIRRKKPADPEKPAPEDGSIDL